MSTQTPVSGSLIGNYPPLYYTRLRQGAGRWWRWFGIISAITLVAGVSFIWDWHNPLMPLAPLIAALWLYSVIAAFASRSDKDKAHVLPYFPKHGPRVGANTFLYGLAIARNFQLLESWASEQAVAPLSAFGWADDACGETLVWHEAAQGVATVSALLKHPELSPELREDLERLLAALQRAANANTPFCLLLRIGDYASGAEMDARQGTFF